MTLNNKEKSKLVDFLKNQYKERKELIANNEFPFYIEDDTARKKFIAETEELKDQYETIDSLEVVEFDTDKLAINGELTWWFLIFAIVFAGNFGNMPTPENDIVN